MKFLKRFGLSLLILGAVLWLNNTSIFYHGGQAETKLIAHRGVHQIYAGNDRNADTCRAQKIHPPAHPHIENTLPSIQAAFQAGADIVEIDVHPTPDAYLAVFHDWTLDCQTDGTGVTRERDLAYLKSLDLAYGFTADGSTFPLRGTGVGLLPELSEVLDAPLGGKILVNFKGKDPQEADLLAGLLEVPERRDHIFGVYGGQAPTRRSLDLIPDMRGYDRASIKDCLFAYMGFGWSGWVPKACHDTLVVVPQSHAAYLWGWPHRFTHRMESVGTEVILVGPWDGTSFTSGIDTAEHLGHVPKGFHGYIWTNKIEIIGPLVKGSHE